MLFSRCSLFVESPEDYGPNDTRLFFLELEIGDKIRIKMCGTSDVLHESLPQSINY